jgi:hypothetical protein
LSIVGNYVLLNNEKEFYPRKFDGDAFVGVRSDGVDATGLSIGILWRLSSS